MRTFVPLLPALALVGCGDHACPNGPDGCDVASACESLAFTCDAGTTEVYVIGEANPGLTGPIAQSAPGDVVLGNDHVIAVIEALDHPHDIAPRGGGLVDLTLRGEPADSLRHVFHATGLLPEDAFHYETLDVLDEGNVKAVLLTGRLDGYPEARVATRYEIRPCEPGVRVRTEIANGGPDPLSWYLTDAWYFGGRGSLPFTPGEGAGFEHPSFGLTTIGEAFRDTPYFATGGHEGPSASFVEVSCSEEQLTGFHSAEISAVGPAPKVVYPGDWLAFERFIGAGPGPSASGGVDIALEIRRQLYGELYVTLSGAVEVPGVRADAVETSVLVSSGGVPYSQAFPDGLGGWSLQVPANKGYTIEARAFGKVVGMATAEVGTDAVTVEPIVLDAPGQVTLDVTVDGVADHVQVFVVPADDATRDATQGDYLGYFAGCAPYLGNPHGNSPACNRVLVDGTAMIPMEPGTYDFYASVGPFSTLAAARGVVVDGGTAQTIALDVLSLDVQPPGTLSGDFHVHGAASFDAQIGDLDRARAFLASGIEVIATTEHDAAWDYADALERLDAEDRLALMVGTESTGHVLFPFRSDSTFPRVTGHWNLWPIDFDPDGAWHGASWDELAEPGLLFTRQRDEGGWDDVDGVAELNHPVGGLQFGRDFGWASAAGFDATQPLKTEYDGTGQSLFFHTPEGAAFSNADYDVQEVMNGTGNGSFLPYRAFWFYLLDQGIVRGGVANSDSHSLTENVLGTPRTLVWTDTTVANFDPAVFNADLRGGRAIGTNGPVIVASIIDGDATYGPSVDTITPSSSATLHLEISAAPWVPVDEVRIIVNGEVAQTLDGLAVPADPFGTDGLERLVADVPLSELLADGTGWIVVEAGHALEPVADLDCDGLPDTGDNNRDGTIDWRDVADLTEAPEADADGCIEDVGPIAEPVAPERGTPDAFFRAVTPDGYPLAFTNPFLVGAP